MEPKTAIIPNVASVSRTFAEQRHAQAGAKIITITPNSNSHARAYPRKKVAMRSRSSPHSANAKDSIARATSIKTLVPLEKRHIHAAINGKSK
jgi:hypothetical protein